MSHVFASELQVGESSELSPAQCRAARSKLGVSSSKMARLLGFGNGRTIRRFECDAGVTAQAPIGPCAVLYALILSDRLTLADLITLSECLPRQGRIVHGHNVRTRVRENFE